MKSIAFLVFGAGLAAAQQLSDIPQCGQTCVTNMVNIANSGFGCSSGDVKCYCSNQNFGYGLRDCANQACGQQVGAQVVSYGQTYCQSALGGASASPTGALSVLSSAAASASSAASGAQSTPVTTQALVATITSGGSTILSTTGFSTLYGSAGSAVVSASSAAASATSSAASAASSILSSANSAASSAASAASSAAGSAASRASSATASGSGGGAPSSSGAAPRMTAAPLAGAAGLAALLFL